MTDIVEDPLSTLTLSLPVSSAEFSGFTPTSVSPYYSPNDLIRSIERASIHFFVSYHSPLLTGRVLDFGSGTQPYKSLVTGEYFPYDLTYFHDDRFADHAFSLLGVGTFDTILCTQVLQYVPDPAQLIGRFFRILKPHNSHLLMTYATNWDEVEPSDLSRLTKSGMESLLTSCGFSILHHHRRAEIKIDSFTFPLGYGVVAKKE